MEATQPVVSEPSKSTPNWDLVHFKVECARCSENLFGQSEPICPACNLTFDWSDAVPLEELTCPNCDYHLYGLSDNHCPECGESFDWNLVVRDYFYRRKPLFEYQWRRHPVRSLVRTWLLAWRPWKLWRVIELHDPPAKSGLLLYFLLLYTFTLLSWPVFDLLTRFNFYLQWGQVPASDLIVQQYALMMFSFTIVMLGGFLTLLLLRQSMQKCRVRNAHVFRAYIYAIVPFLIIPIILGYVAFATWTLYPQSCWRLYLFTERAAPVLIIGCWLWTTISLAIAYRRYMKMPHAWGIAIASQIIALLSMIAVIAAIDMAFLVSPFA